MNSSNVSDKKSRTYITTTSIDPLIRIRSHRLLLTEKSLAQDFFPATLQCLKNVINPEKYLPVQSQQ